MTVQTARAIGTASSAIASAAMVFAAPMFAPLLMIGFIAAVYFIWQ